MTKVEKLYQGAMALPPYDFQRLIKMLSETEPARPEMTEEEFQMRLMNEGIIRELPEPVAKDFLLSRGIECGRTKSPLAALPTRAR